MYPRLACYCLLVLWTCSDDGPAELMMDRALGKAGADSEQDQGKVRMAKDYLFNRY